MREILVAFAFGVLASCGGPQPPPPVTCPPPNEEYIPGCVVTPTPAMDAWLHYLPLADDCQMAIRLPDGTARFYRLADGNQACIDAGLRTSRVGELHRLKDLVSDK